jgi:chromosome segregation ATPase
MAEENTDLSKKVKELEAEIERLRQREKKFEHDIAIFQQVFHHLKQQFEQMKKEIGKGK